jgi:energy-converting hydrogenase B subunit D
MRILIIVVGLFMIAGSLAVLFHKSIKSAVIIMGIVSLLSTFLFVMMKAYDVAITEASIGAVLTTAIYFFAIKRIEEDKKTSATNSDSLKEE